MKDRKRTTYLSRVESNYFSRKWYSRSVTLFCNLLFTGQWMRKAQIPDHLYLVIGHVDVLVGSIIVHRDPGHLHLCFLKELSPGFVNRLARMTSPFATLESLDRHRQLNGIWNLMCDGGR